MGDERAVEPPDPDEKRLRRNLRYIGGVVFLVLISILALADTFGRSANIHANEFIVGSLVGAFLLIVAVEGAALLSGRK